MGRPNIGDGSGNGNGDGVVEVEDEVSHLGDGEDGGCGEGWRNLTGEEGGVSRAHTCDEVEVRTETRKRGPESSTVRRSGTAVCDCDSDTLGYTVGYEHAMT